MLFRAPRQQLYAITPDVADTDLLLAKCAAALSAGVGALQYRNKVASAALRRTQAQQLRPLCEHFNTPFIINDNWRLAEELGAAGAHLGRDDSRLAGIRSHFSGVLGISCYNNLDDARRAEQEGADYVAFGSFFASPVKPAAVVAELELLERARSTLALPIVAIGGITLENAASLRAAGADAVAVISGLFDADDIGARVAAFNQLLIETDLNDD